MFKPFYVICATTSISSTFGATDEYELFLCKNKYSSVSLYWSPVFEPKILYKTETDEELETFFYENIMKEKSITAMAREAFSNYYNLTSISLTIRFSIKKIDMTEKLYYTIRG